MGEQGIQIEIRISVIANESKSKITQILRSILFFLRSRATGNPGHASGALLACSVSVHLSVWLKTSPQNRFKFTLGINLCCLWCPSFMMSHSPYNNVCSHPIPYCANKHLSGLAWIDQNHHHHLLPCHYNVTISLLFLSVTHLLQAGKALRIKETEIQIMYVWAWASSTLHLKFLNFFFSISKQGGTRTRHFLRFLPYLHPPASVPPIFVLTNLVNSTHCAPKAHRRDFISNLFDERVNQLFGFWK